MHTLNIINRFPTYTNREIHICMDYCVLLEINWSGLFIKLLLSTKISSSAQCHIYLRLTYVYLYHQSNKLIDYSCLVLDEKDIQNTKTILNKSISQPRFYQHIMLTLSCSFRHSHCLLLRKKLNKEEVLSLFIQRHYRRHQVVTFIVMF